MAKKQQSDGLIPIGKFNFGGLSDSKFSGLTNSLYKMTGWDPHSTPGLLKVAQKMAKNSGSIIDELCKERINCSNGIRYWFSSMSGKVWQEKNGTYTLVFTVSPSASSSLSKSPSLSPSISPSLSPSTSLSPSISPSPSESPSLSPSVSPSLSASSSLSPSISLSPSLSPSQSPSQSTSLSPSISPSISPSPSPAIGANACLGAAEYQGYMYFATQLKLHRINIDNADGASAWNSNVETSWATFDIGDESFHPMLETSGGVLYIGDGNQIAQVDAGVFSSNALDIKTPLRVKCLGSFGTDLLIGTYVSNNITETEIIRWNTWNTDTFQSSDPIPEVGINAFLPGDNIIYAQCGLAGRIYVYDGEKLNLYKTIPGDYSPSATAEVYPSSVTNIGGDIYFGVSNITGNPCDEGIYRLGRYSMNYPYILDFPYPISERLAGELVTTGVYIGGLMAVGSVIGASWRNDAGTDTFGIDKLDYTNKLENPFYETMVMTMTRDAFANFSKAIVNYYSLPTGTSIDMYLDLNHAGISVTPLTTVDDIDRNIVETKDEGIEFTTLRLKVKATSINNLGAEIESSGIFVR